MSAVDVDAARKLHDWFNTVLRLLDDGLFGVVPDGPHREAVVLGVLSRNARELLNAELDRMGGLYTPLTLVLAAACRRSDCSLTAGNWQAAIENVTSQTRRLSESREYSDVVGIDLGSPASVFKQLFDEALIDSGLAGLQSFLDEENRQLALGLAINWGIRFLLAYANESAAGLPRPEPSRRDLAWIANLVGV